jgi:adenylate cyclase
MVVRQASSKSTVRRLAALLVADAVGYAGLMRLDEDATHHQVSADLDTLFAPRIRRYRGRVVKTTGDGLLAEFPSIVACVTCAIEIQQALAGRQLPADADAGPLYRIGINLGDVIIERNDVYGDGVNVAARLQALASPGGILLSGEAYQQVRRKLDVEFEDLGHHNVKSITEPVHVFRVGTGALPAERPARSGAGSPSFANLPSVAVLPFDALGRDPKLGHFCDGITNDIITDLSKYSELSVIASHTVFSYKGKPVTVADVGRELGVRYVVEGSVQRVASRSRMNVQLIEATTGAHLWAERYDRPTKALSADQDEIVQTIVGTLVTQVSRLEILQAKQKPHDTRNAYDFYQIGRAAWFEWTSEANRQAEECFAKAIALEPNYARAYGYLATTLVQAWMCGWSPAPDLIPRARTLAQQAVALGPSDFENHWSVAAVYLYHREFDKAMAAYQRAADLNPHSSGLLADTADAFVLLGRVEEAVAMIQRAIRINPIHPDGYYWTLGAALYHAGRVEEAVAALTRIANPPNLLRRNLAAAYARLGRLSEAREVAAEFLAHDPAYRIERERIWPYKDPTMLEAFIADLRAAGLPR